MVKVAPIQLTLPKPLNKDDSMHCNNIRVKIHFLQSWASLDDCLFAVDYLEAHN